MALCLGRQEGQSSCAASLSSNGRSWVHCRIGARHGASACPAPLVNVSSSSKAPSQIPSSVKPRLAHLPRQRTYMFRGGIPCWRACLQWRLWSNSRLSGKKHTQRVFQSQSCLSKKDFSFPLVSPHRGSGEGAAGRQGEEERSLFY